ncbi:Uncharacterised protein [Streptococcus suis]|nr:Uncharacterised protein [Streptococcus suis]CYU40368.1 Uncharacterised protein [Streptococcus suis]
MSSYFLCQTRSRFLIDEFSNQFIDFVGFNFEDKIMFSVVFCLLFI